ncbi:MAG: ketoacyl-ACP synthase III [Proteobacteria bacterium]|nr:ketoacyl-ACP synthase III [Pseudomonadota bacterium]
MLNSKIIATGSYLPQKIVTNSDLAKTVDTSNEWILERTGIEQRHIAAEDELTSDLAAEAAKRAIANSGLKPEEIDMIIVATTTPDLTFPATATTVQAKIGAKVAFAFDVQAVCSGFVFALTTADNFIKSGQVKNALVIGADKLSSIVDWTDRNTCVLFGDGAGAVVLQATEEKNRGIIASSLYSDGTLNDILKTSGGPASNQKSGFIEMAGKEVFKHAVDKMVKSVIATLAKAELTTKDIDLLVPHQANLRILNAVATRLELPEEKTIITVQKHANTSAASIPLALDQANSQKRIKDGDVVVLEALGGGLTWGSVVLKW